MSEPGSPSATIDPASGAAVGGKKGAGEAVELSRAAQAHARRMAESKAIVPHQYLRAELDATGLASSLGEMGEGVGVADALVRAAGLALARNPEANGSYRDGKLTRNGRVNVGLWVESAEAPVVPVLADADRTGTAELAAERARLEAAVREGTIKPPDLAGATFTVIDLAGTGVAAIDPVIVPPQAGILAAGDVRTVGGTPTITLTLACDARVLDPHRAARFLAEARTLLEEPERLR